MSDTSSTTTPRCAAVSFHRVAAGFALSTAGIVLFATGFVEIDPLVGVPAALAAAVGVYLVAGFAMPNARLRH